jgi:anti-sigma factor RsiW
MACEQVRSKLEDYLAATLSREEISNFESHTRSCENCAGYVGEMVRLAGLLRLSVSDRAPDRVWDGIAARLDAAEPQPMIRLMRTFSAIAAAALLVFGLVAVRSAGDDPNLHRIQTSEVSWTAGDEVEDELDHVQDILLTPRSK